MPVGDDRVYGLKGVIGLVRDFMTRAERNGSLQSEDFPILVVEGFRGTGKSAVLSKLDTMLDQVPHARLDLETNRHASVPELLSAAAFDLSRKYPKYTLRFPRFIIGQLVMRLELDLTDHSQACQQVETALERYRDLDAVREVLADTAGSVLASMGSGAGLPITPPASLLRYVVTWLSRRAPSRQLTLGPFQAWYGHRDLKLRGDPIDVLVDLNRWAADPDDEHNRQRIDELLWAAFLADLRSEFDRGRRADERSLNCVVLLDNADTELGRRFLGQVVHARRQRAVGEPDGADPLTVVATSRGDLLAEVPEADQVRVAPEELRAGSAHHPDWSRYWWVGYRLPDLTEDEVGRAVADMGLLLSKHQRLTRVVYQLTGGHPAATSLVLDAIARDTPSKWIEPEAILGRDERLSQDVPTVAERILDRLLTGTSEPTRRDLVTCAPARGQAQTLALAGRDDLLVNSPAAYEKVVPLLWSAEGSAGLTLLRRLLTRQLAERADPDEPSWSQVHARLRHICRAGDDEAGDLYHALADGEVGFVAAHLHRRLTELECAEWYELTTSVAEAPRRPRTGGAPADEMRTLVAAAELEPAAAAVGRLVAALHVVADPFTDSRRSDVHLQIADDWGEIGRLRPGGPHAVFLDAARRHRREAEWWD